MLTGSVRAAEVSCLRVAPAFGCRALLRGEIVKGDYQRVRSFMANYGPTDFTLVSPGGDVDEALKIGRLFRKHLVLAEAPYRKADGSIWIYGLDRMAPCRGQNCTCASACALIWFGAVEREGIVGLHRPYIDDPMFAGLAPAEASIRYRQMLDSVVSYLSEMEVPKSIIESMTATGSGDIRWLDMIDEGLHRPPSIAEWVGASCGRSDAWMEAYRRNQLLSDQQWEALQRAHARRNECAWDLFDKHRVLPSR
jgi:hypothetical protein